MITPEMLLFLARKIELNRPTYECGGVCLVKAQGVCLVKTQGVWLKFAPHIERAQWADVVLWAAETGHNPDLMRKVSSAWHEDLLTAVSIDHTKAGIMAATIEAIARAAGYDDAAIAAGGNDE